MRRSVAGFHKLLTVTRLLIAAMAAETSGPESQPKPVAGDRVVEIMSRVHEDSGAVSGGGRQ